ncbi:hypothetical protein CORC01_12500 [Colletotrichum orchidophilum]|uniref:Cytochrome P450 n=1 Tax=Colletotrichum orchidophilum TaxID=1209926 RepID=A0A1G4ASX7_9PEZI|nr:uncharacterized protein CORC01_12500 [Colletotrichum orchidophilum]OHE92206.1 hypothetical protein CORC01_12500 [Colletotrichum orchidophilum]
MLSIDSHHLALGLVVVLLVFLGSTLRAAFRPGLRSIPGPFLARFTPLWRLSFVWKGNAHSDYRQLHHKYGPVVRTAPNAVDISDPAALQTIYGITSKFMKSNFYNVFDNMYEDEFMPSMFTTTNAEVHKALKRPVAQKYSMTSIRTLEYLVNPCTQMFTDAMTDLQGQVVDLGTWVQWYAFDVIGAITFSRRFGFMETRSDVNNVIAGIEGGLEYGGLVGVIPSLHKYLLGNITLRKILTKFGTNDPLRTVTNMVLDALGEYDAKPGSSERGDFLAYLRREQASTGDQLSTPDMMNHLMNNLLAGSDTTGIALRAMFYYVLRDKRVYDVLQKEIDEAQARGELSPVITFAESQKLEYLQACIKEAMRMHPGVSYPLERVVPETGAEISGFHLPAGTIVGMNAAVIHRDRDIFGHDADTFRPERWLSDDVEAVKTMDRHNMSFGAGVRTCIGKNISIMEVGKVVPQILRQFHLEWASSEPEWQVSTYWFAKQSGLLVRFSPRAPVTK